MFNIHKKCEERLERLQRAYAECYSENVELKDKVAKMKLDNADLAQSIDHLTDHITALALINGALMEVVSEEQKAKARKIVLEKEKSIKVEPKKKGRKNVKVKKAK